MNKETQMLLLCLTQFEDLENALKQINIDIIKKETLIGVLKSMKDIRQQLAEELDHNDKGIVCLEE